MLPNDVDDMQFVVDRLLVLHVADLLTICLRALLLVVRQEWAFVFVCLDLELEWLWVLLLLLLLLRGGLMGWV